MELDLQSLCGLLVQLYSLSETLQLPPFPPHLGSYTRALLVSQDRRHLFVTPWAEVFINKIIFNQKQLLSHAKPNFLNLNQRSIANDKVFSS
jgi:hypothetical protein